MAIAMFVAGATASANLFIASAALFLALGYVLGLVPAAIAGVSFAFAPRGFQRLWLAPVFGVAGVWLADAIGGSISSGVLVMGVEPVHLGAGAVAAFVCAWIARGKAG